MNAFGGLVVGMAIKYADAIVKDLALGVSICFSAVGSIFFFDFSPSWGFLAGVLVFSYAASLYAGNADCGGLFAQPPKQEAQKTPKELEQCSTAGRPLE